MYSSVIRPAPSVHSCLFADVEDNIDDAGSRCNLDADTSDFVHEVYLSMVWQRGFLGLAFYDLGSLQIHFMLDVQENDAFSLVRQVLHQIHPSVIAINSVQDSRLLSFLRATVSEMSMAQSGSSNDTCRIEFLPNVDFNYQVGKRRILALQLASVPKHLSDDERYLYFSSLLPFDNSHMISSIGGLLKYLEKSRVGIELESDVAHVPLVGFKAFIPEHLIQMDGQTYCALKIFETEIHPSTYKAGHKSGKEGLSLYGILNRCKSTIGSRMLREWFLRPLKSAAPLKQRHEAISFFMESQNMEVVHCFNGCLKHIKYIPKVLLRMSKAQATIGDWIALYRTLYHAVYIGDIAKAQPGNIEIFRKIKSTFTEDLHKCVNLISKTIDFEESKLKKRFVVLPHINKTLDDKKRTFNGLPDLMSEVARKEIEGLSSDIRECAVSYLPEIGYLLVIELPMGKTAEEYQNIEGLKFMFQSNNQIYCKSSKTLELDYILGDTQLEIIEIEVEIIVRLQNTILESTSVMLSIMELAAELDCLMALATCAGEFGYSKPQLVEETVINIKAGRHPLQELCCNVFVPNDITMGGSSSKMKLITGPNACGKSVYLKQVALIVFMAHIGSFIPAEEASIGPCDAIFSRLKSTESVSVHLSTFMQDLSQVSHALKSASANSLVIMDEFGKGTESTDGLSLLTAVMKFWIEKGSKCPFTLIVTHFHSIIQQRLLPNSAMVENLTFDNVTNGDELIFLYQLIPGYTSSSYACKCAAQVGIPNEVVQRGQQVSDLLSQFKPVPSQDTSSSMEQKRMHEKIVDKFLSLNLKEDDVKEFLNNFVLKLWEERNKVIDMSKSLSESGNDHEQRENESHPSCKVKAVTQTNRKHNASPPGNSNEIEKQKENMRLFSAGPGKETPETTSLAPQKSLSSLATHIDSSNNNKSSQNLVKQRQQRTDHRDAIMSSPFLETNNNCDNGDKKTQGRQHHNEFDVKRSLSTQQKETEWLIRNSSHKNQLVVKAHADNNSDSRTTNTAILPKEKQKRQHSHLFPSHPMYTTPSSPQLLNLETYHKSRKVDTFHENIKRGCEIFEPTSTRIKHEILFDPPTPCFGIQNISIGRSVPIPTKTMTDFASKQSSSSTTDTDDPQSTRINKPKDISSISNEKYPPPWKRKTKIPLLSTCTIGKIEKVDSLDTFDSPPFSPMQLQCPKSSFGGSTSSSSYPRIKNNRREDSTDLPTSGTTTPMMGNKQLNKGLSSMSTS